MDPRTRFSYFFGLGLIASKNNLITGKTFRKITELCTSAGRAGFNKCSGKQSKTVGKVETGNRPGSQQTKYHVLS